LKNEPLRGIRESGFEAGGLVEQGGRQVDSFLDLAERDARKVVFPEMASQQSRNRHRDSGKQLPKPHTY
jgi:hypothetical protein